MMSLKKLMTASVVAGTMLFALPANAATIVGQAVDAIGSINAAVGNLDTRPLLGAGANNAIEYFIPLGNTDGTYGVDNAGSFGTVSDSGTGGGILTMFLRFDGLIANSGTLSILFEDLDLTPVNDPPGFTETIQIFDQNGTELTTGIISDVLTPSPFSITTAGGPNDTLELALALGPIAASTFFIELNFAASFASSGTNTAEYLRATFTENLSVVPLPAALPLYGTGLAIMGFVGWRRKRKTAA